MDFQSYLVLPSSSFPKVFKVGSSAKERVQTFPSQSPLFFFNHSINLGKLFQSFAVSDKSHNIQVLLM